MQRKWFHKWMIAALCLCTAFITAAQEKEALSTATSMRELSFTGLNGASITGKDFPKEQMVLLMYFRPDCGHCRLDAEKIPGLSAWYPVPLWMVSAMDKASVQTFIEDFQLDKADNIRFMLDTARMMHQWYHFDRVPFLILVNNKGQVIKEFEYLPTPQELRATIEAEKDMEEQLSN